MRLLFPVCLIASLVCLPIGAQATIGVPDPSRSSMDPCLLACPLADLAFHVTVRDVAGFPIAGAMVVLNFSQCPTFAHCPDIGPGLTWNDFNHEVSALTDVSGLAGFSMAVGGVCGSVSISADGVPLGQRVLA